MDRLFIIRKLAIVPKTVVKHKVLAINWSLLDQSDFKAGPASSG